MLNISENRIHAQVDENAFSSFRSVFDPKAPKVWVYWLVTLTAIFIVFLFMPWTQNIRAKGKLTTLDPSQRPQVIPSTLDGRIENWYVALGDTVNAGDTILHLIEVKDDYFDPALLDRTDEQIAAKGGAVNAYRDKATALSQQGQALTDELQLKLVQAENKVLQSRLKVVSDSMDMVAAGVADSVAALQLARWDTLFKRELKSRTDLEKMRKERQAARAKYIAWQNKLGQSRVELATAQIEIGRLRTSYQEKLAKVQSDLQSAQADRATGEAEISKMQNQRANYELRTQYRYVMAPTSGVITEVMKSGVGEIVKAGDALVQMVPLNQQLAAEINIRPVDLPLIHKGEEVRLEFDGWPALIFGAGWPNIGVGTFPAQIYAIDNNIGPDGTYRVILIESRPNSTNPNEAPWPKALRIGGGVNAFAMLKDVPIWYEIWRQLNGFPPEFYTPSDVAKDEAKVKKPSK